MKLKSIAYALMIVAVMSCGIAQECLAQDGAAQRKTMRPGGGKARSLPAVTAEEAKELLGGDSGYIYLDVRTPEEFEAGRPPGAINIPVLLTDAETNRKTRNKDFLAVVEAHIPKDAKVIVGCRSGNRSMMAQRILHKAGYTDTVNMLGGFSGQKNPAGKVRHEGWSDHGYPIKKGAAGPVGYDELKKEAKL